MSTQTISTQTEAREIISRDPGTGAELGRVPISSPEDVQSAVYRARAAQPAWAKRSFHERGQVILKARERMLAQVEELGLLISRETGKPVSEAISMEIVPTLDAMHHLAHNAEKSLSPQKLDIGQYGLMGRSSRIVYKPVGVVGIISPWNFPLATPAQEIVMALVAGNSVVLKPSELTTLTALKLGEIFRDSGLPTGLLEIVTGYGATGASLIDARVDKIMFTGSVATGRRVAAAAANHLTPMVLELGGKDPMIVLEDADVANAARAAVWGAFANSGQACASVERCYVHESVAPQFLARVLSETAALKQDVGTKPDTDVGAMTNERQLQIVEEHVADALVHGAKVVSGGKRVANSAGFFYPPTVLTNVDHGMKIMRDETFGPVLPVMTFETEDEAVELANDSVFGLTASVWTRDISRGRQIAEKIAAGTVMVNEVLYTHGIAQTPWGGVKESGYGRTHGRAGLLELVNPHHIHVNRFGGQPDLWWFRYNPSAGSLFRNLANYFTSGSILKSARMFPAIVRRLLDQRKIN